LLREGPLLAALFFSEFRETKNSFGGFQSTMGSVRTPLSIQVTD
jgi:hypothetical protein